MARMTIYAQAKVSNNIIQLFRKEYEKFVLEIMNTSVVVFPGCYEQVTDQSHGECDFVDVKSGKKFDAKLPFKSEQVKLLTNGRNHAPKIEEWINAIKDEVRDYDVFAIRNHTYDVTRTELYSIIYRQITKDKTDENIVLFLPFPVGTGLRGNSFTHHATDFLRYIFEKMEEEIDFSDRTIYAIYPIHEKNIFAVRDLRTMRWEYVECGGLGQYFTYEIVDYHVR